MVLLLKLIKSISLKALFSLPTKSSGFNSTATDFNYMTFRPFLSVLAFPLLKICSYSSMFNLVDNLKKIFIPNPFLFGHFVLLSVILIVFRSCLVCYNIVTSYIPPMALGRFELPRQLASGCQDCHVCQLRHSAVKSGGSASAKILLPLILSHKTVTQMSCLVKLFVVKSNVVDDYLLLEESHG